MAPDISTFLRIRVRSRLFNCHRRSADDDGDGYRRQRIEGDFHGRQRVPAGGDGVAHRVLQGLVLHLVQLVCQAGVFAAPVGDAGQHAHAHGGNAGHHPVARRDPVSCDLFAGHDDELPPGLALLCLGRRIALVIVRLVILPLDIPDKIRPGLRAPAPFRAQKEVSERRFPRRCVIPVQVELAPAFPAQVDMLFFKRVFLGAELPDPLSADIALDYSHRQTSVYGFPDQVISIITQRETGAHKRIISIMDMVRTAIAWLHKKIFIKPLVIILHMCYSKTHKGTNVYFFHRGV